jgi:hypothetical protein
MWFYRDTIRLDPDEPSEAMGVIDDAVNEFGFSHGHKSNDSVEFQIEANSQWELREKVAEFLLSLGSLVTGYEINKECVYWSFEDDNA